VERPFTPIEEDPMVNEAAFNDLRTRFRGSVLTPADPGYDEARRVHNGMFVRRPAVVARCLGTADVVDAVRFARRHDLELAVRGGGHSVAGSPCARAG
jgi:FAD/FMN-containing dehydrogenase